MTTKLVADGFPTTRNEYSVVAHNGCSDCHAVAFKNVAEPYLSPITGG